MIDDWYPAGSVSGDVVLSHDERAVLAQMAAGLDDPWLASQLLGTVPVPVRPRRSFSIPTCWSGIMLLLVGAAIALGTFTHWLPIAVLGLALMAGGGALLIVPQRKSVRPRVRPVAERGQWAPRTSTRRRPLG